MIDNVFYWIDREIGLGVRSVNKITIKEVAEKANVSVSTVSRVLKRDRVGGS